MKNRYELNINNEIIGLDSAYLSINYIESDEYIDPLQDESGVCLYKVIEGIITPKDQQNIEEDPVYISYYAKKDLSNSDKSFIRGVDDLIDILITKEIIAENDLPEALKNKYNTRKALREDL